MKNFLKLFIISFLLFTLALPVLAAPDDGSYGLNKTLTENAANALSKSDIDGPGGAGGFLSAQTGSAIGVLLSFLGIIFLVLIIFGGIQWMVSSGNEEQVKKAKQIMISATIGLVIVFAAYAITSYVGQILTTK